MEAYVNNCEMNLEDFEKRICNLLCNIGYWIINQYFVNNFEELVTFENSCVNPKSIFGISVISELLHKYAVSTD